jgi:hypothetical protein
VVVLGSWVAVAKISVWVSLVFFFFFRMAVVAYLLLVAGEFLLGCLCDRSLV